MVRLRAAEKGGRRGSHISRAAPHGTCRSPALAAYIVLRTTGGSVRLWVRQVLPWRVQPRWYLYALGLPVLLFAVVNLPRLQQRITPLRATLLLAVLWGLWHLPIYGIAFVGPMLFAVFYPYLYNRTGSVGLCMLLHGSFTAALDNLTLTPDNPRRLPAASGDAPPCSGRLGKGANNEPDHPYALTTTH